MKLKTLIILIALCPMYLLAQLNTLFPEIPCVDLNEKAITIPNDTKGKFTLIGVAFSEQAQKDLYSWSQPVYNMFMDENNLNSMVYDPNVHLILMFTGANQVVYNKAKQQITDGSEESLKDNIVLFKGKMEDYRKDLDMKDRKSPYFFVLDKMGKIIYKTKGRYSQKVLNEVAELIEE
ncbi:MAG: hypothetical protein DWP98_14200 [Bacteroidetes bacterium]|nr:MAG: hypothetical protein DWP98_14200 [Bacteroidota bacterium]MBL1145354.1 hypothetical protein [Bacteroidota bacterium]MCB0801885.1 hypothetical protein [Flavobacteriales bacterium]NOG58152.1 hypothetical protein [Bacteroidota bacterium]